MSDSQAVISLQNVTKSFNDHRVLNGVTFDVNAGETMVVMGGSGCGKSTTLRMMIGSFPPDDGRIELWGNNVPEMDEQTLKATRLKVGVLFQSGALFNSMTIAENVALPLQEHAQLDPTTVDIMVKIKLELVGLREHADKYPAQISGGMKKRAGLARALALDPKILFYDEPSAGLDPVTSAEIDQLMVDLSKKLGVTSVVVTHEMDSAFTIADRMVMLDKGKVLAVNDREWFEQLRDTEDELPEREAIIRQFLRGSATGPITDRKQSTKYAEDLLGTSHHRRLMRGPSIMPTHSPKTPKSK